MSKRYGRNQKRAARLLISDLEKQVAKSKTEKDLANNRAWAAETRSMNAEQNALQRLANKGEYIDYAVKRITEELARALGPHLLPHAQRLLDADRRHDRPPIRFTADFNQLQQYHVLRGEIPSINYNVAIF